LTIINILRLTAFREAASMFEPIWSLILEVAGKVAATFAHNWPYLLFGMAGAAAVQVSVRTDRLEVWLRRRRRAAVAGAVGAAVATPLCSCGTTAVVLSALVATVPWAPVVAFMVASPLSSPSELFLSAGLFGWPFALLFFGGSIGLGLAAGAVAAGAERLGWLRDQARFATGDTTRASCATPPAAVCFGPGAACATELRRSRADRWRLPALGRALVSVARRTLPLFVGFAALGYLVTALIPQGWIADWLGGTSPLSTVVAATLGIPFYLNSDGSLPLVATLMDGGMGTGPAMAFLVTGAGTSLGAISGGLLIARWRVLALVVGSLWVGAVVLGLAADALAVG
jgi:uncharacterized membrane protein YraQ (UPF0718 family)